MQFTITSGKCEYGDRFILFRFQPGAMTLPFAPLDIVLHFETYLPLIIQEYSLLTYIILFVILFCETGLVVTPYLPGDTLLFVAGALAGAGILDIWILLATLILAAILGDTFNYWIGHTFEMRVLEWRYSFVKKNSWIRLGSISKNMEASLSLSPGSRHSSEHLSPSLPESKRCDTRGSWDTMSSGE